MDSLQNTIETFYGIISSQELSKMPEQLNWISNKDNIIIRNLIDEDFTGRSPYSCVFSNPITSPRELAPTRQEKDPTTWIKYI